MNTTSSLPLAPLNALKLIDDGFHAVHYAIGARMPKGFHWNFAFSPDDCHIAYWWGSVHEGLREVRARTVRGVLLEWQKIDWSTAREEMAR